MDSNRGLDTKTLASEFSSFLVDPKKMGGGYRTTFGESSVRCEMGKYVFEYDFISRDECKVTITNGSSIEDTLEISYIHIEEADFMKLLGEACALIKD